MGKIGVNVLAVVTVALAGIIASVAAVAQTPGQKIYLDPATGKVIGGPQAAKRRASGDNAGPKQTPNHGGARNNGPQADGARAWKTPDGIQMVTPDPKQAPITHAVRCPDGSLRIGSAAAKKGETARAALCAQAAH